MAEPVRPASMAKRVIATALDLITAFFVFGFAIAQLTGNRAGGSFNLEGWPALVLFALIVAYFVVGRRFAGGTLWDRILGIARPQPR